MSLAVEECAGSAVQVHLHGFEPLLREVLDRVFASAFVEQPSVASNVHLVRVALTSIEEQVAAPTPWIAVLDVRSAAMDRVARRAGASAVVTRDDGLEALQQAVRDVAMGRTTKPLSAAGRPDPLGSLSPRQVTVLALITRRATNEDIASELGISPNTARTHVQNVLTKLGVRNRLAAAAVGRAAGLGR